MADEVETEGQATLFKPEELPAVAVKVEETIVSELSATEQKVWAWFSEHIHNSPVSRSVEAINHLREALPSLIAVLDK